MYNIKLEKNSDNKVNQLNNLELAARSYFSDQTDDSLELLIDASRKFIVYFAGLYGGGCSMDDLKQVGLEGFLKAVKKYNPNFGVLFTTYAGHCIIGEIRHFVREEMQYYRPGILVNLNKKIGNYIDEKFGETGELPAVKDISHEFNIKAESVGEIMKTGLISFDDIKVNKIAARRNESFKLVLEDRIMLEQALKKLSVLQQNIIRMLFFRGMTQEAASYKLGLNQRKVSRIKEQSLTELRKMLSE